MLSSCFSKRTDQSFRLFTLQDLGKAGGISSFCWWERCLGTLIIHRLPRSADGGACRYVNHLEPEDFSKKETKDTLKGLREYTGYAILIPLLTVLYRYQCVY